MDPSENSHFILSAIKQILSIISGLESNNRKSLKSPLSITMDRAGPEGSAVESVTNFKILHVDIDELYIESQLNNLDQI